MYYNASVTTKDGESVPLRVAMHNFFKSPAWAETKDTIKQIWAYYKHNGWKSIWQEIVSAFDPQGEANAYKVSTAVRANLKLNKVRCVLNDL